MEYDAGHARVAHVIRNLGNIDRLRALFVVLPFDERAAEVYGRVRADLEQGGTLIGPNDLLIAATALAHDLTLVTHNTREVTRVPGLCTEDWHAPPPAEGHAAERTPPPSQP